MWLGSELSMVDRQLEPKRITNLSSDKCANQKGNETKQQ